MSGTSIQALIRESSQIVENDRYPILPRIRRLRDIPGELGPFAIQALAKALGFRDAGKIQEAREWAAEPGQAA